MAIINAVKWHFECKRTVQADLSGKKHWCSCKSCFDKTFAGGAAFNRIIGETKKLLRKNAFTPEKVLIQMDLNGGMLQ